MKKTSKISKIIWCIVRRTLLLVLTAVILFITGIVMLINHIFTGPFPEARKVLVMSLEEASATKWIAPLFIGEEAVYNIIHHPEKNLFIEESTNTELIHIDLSGSISGVSDEWKNAEDGIRIDHISGDTYKGYVMLIRDPSRVYLATSSETFSKEIPGKRITKVIKEEKASAAINAGAFFDNGTSSPEVGSVPEGLTVSKGKIVWEEGDAPVGKQTAFVGFTYDNKLIVSQNIKPENIEQMKIRDGCSFGPILVVNGAINEGAYNGNSGFNPRTAIGQRADGAVIFLCVDGRQPNSLGATYKDLIDIMVEYGAVNACNLDGGSSTVMLQRNKTTGEVKMINSYSLLQEEPRKMPTFFMVK
ncbi:MAG: hypothetical protein E7665_05075 [Ruminococcaceae bacterium]|nr:hypothetical protein [Oscillospiraceae bacterium]